MVDNRRRNDPYKTFNFRVAIGAALAGLAALVGVKTLRNKNGGEASSGSRPIEGVGTAVPGAARTARAAKPKSKSKARPANRAQPARPRRRKASTRKKTRS